MEGLEPGERLLLELVLDESVEDIEFSESFSGAPPPPAFDVEAPLNEVVFILMLIVDAFMPNVVRSVVVELLAPEFIDWDDFTGEKRVSSESSSSSSFRPMWF